MTRQRIGIFAGTFDPVHDGHLALAETALVHARLNKVIFLPEPQPRRKINVSPVSDRAALIRDKLAGIDSLEIHVIDQPTFSVAHTLPVITRLYPDADFALLIGSDVVEFLGNWDNFEIIQQTMRILVGIRSGHELSALSTKLDQLDVKYDFIETNFSSLSSSQLRLAQRSTSYSRQ